MLKKIVVQANIRRLPLGDCSPASQKQNLSHRFKGVGHRIFVVILAISLCFAFTACSSDGKKHMEVSKAQAAVLDLKSAKISVTTVFESDTNSSTIKTDFSFVQNTDKTLSYCQMQYDTSNKPIFCEYSDGEKTEQWLIGSGWNVTDTVKYNKESPHRYLNLLATSFDEKSIATITGIDDSDVTTYTMELDPKVLNKTTYKDSQLEMISQSVSLLVNSKNQLVRYSDTSTIFDKITDSKNMYMLDMTLSEQNILASINRPELREY